MCGLAVPDQAEPSGTVLTETVLRSQGPGRQEEKETGDFKDPECPRSGQRAPNTNKPKTSLRGSGAVPPRRHNADMTGEAAQQQGAVCAGLSAAV